MPPSASLNRKIIHTIPLEFRLDGKEVLGRVVGMKGVKLEAKTLFITCLEHHLNDLISVVEDAGIEVEDVIASPLASGLVTLTKAHKIVGCVLVNIGAETTSMVVYENNLPVALDVLPIGSMDTTNAVALGLRISLEEAESVKIGGISGFDTQKKMEEIRIAELRKIFSKIEAQLKSIGKSELLPAGVVILGGGALVNRIEELARDELRLPSRRATIQLLGSRTGNSTLDPSLSIAYGLCVLGSTDDEDGSTGIKLVKTTGRNILTWVKQFLP
jgi:cell division protein FtsA